MWHSDKISMPIFKTYPGKGTDCPTFVTIKRAVTDAALAGVGVGVHARLCMCVCECACACVCTHVCTLIDMFTAASMRGVAGKLRTDSSHLPKSAAAAAFQSDSPKHQADFAHP